MKINNLQVHFEIFGIIGLIPVGSFILNCIRKNNLMIDLIAIKESNTSIIILIRKIKKIIGNADNSQLSNEEILKSMSVIINKYCKEKEHELEAIVVKNEIKPFIDIKINLKENNKYKVRIMLKKIKANNEYCLTIHHHYWISQYIIGIKRSLELQLIMRVLREWRFL